MKIGIVGSGITGLGAALALSEDHDVTVFEAADRIGGHANTVDVAFPDGAQPVDTGFIVYNYRNYPNLVSMFEYLDVPTKWSDMSFGFSLNAGRFEYACDNLDKMFAQRWRVLDPRYLAAFREILRFTKVAPRDLNDGSLEGLSLGEWLDRRGFSAWFRERFLLPMGGAIWSTCVGDVLHFPARNFVGFFVNHDLMTGLDPAQRWRTVDGGSREYVSRLTARLQGRIHTGRPVACVRPGDTPRIAFMDGAEEAFDHVLIATHGPQAHAMLDGADDQTNNIVSTFRTSQNRAILHSDPALMPRRRRVWSSWNFLSMGMTEDSERPAQVTYWMNRLQGIDRSRQLFVSLNPTKEPAANLTHAAFDYAHPLYDTATFRAQGDIDAVQGRGGVWFAGAWLGHGFHEDGLRAGLRVAEALGTRPAWVRDTGTPIRAGFGQAAE